ncbi:hypothetical protein BDW42DRAFT_147051 [Aspergillus taichungensis]|uniref:Secreted protein n=1 Tax=Aspergillus taichungensis TaxID=482145 RepID=A0A2J5HLR7_9EURO|nr:hypothetical protein BDW42DRAFT_147051 [Aspergillus taichungensis]
MYDALCFFFLLFSTLVNVRLHLMDKHFVLCIRSEPFLDIFLSFPISYDMDHLSRVPTLWTAMAWFHWSCQMYPGGIILSLIVRVGGSSWPSDGGS